MIDVDNEKNYRNQLQFDLDASSIDSESFASGKCIIIEKLRKKTDFPSAITKEKSEYNPSDVFKKAAELARLDLSNSQWEERYKTKPKKENKTVIVTKEKRLASDKAPVYVPVNEKKLRTIRPVKQKHHKVDFIKKNKQKVAFKDPPGFEERVHDIITRHHENNLLSESHKKGFHASDWDYDTTVTNIPPKQQYFIKKTEFKKFGHSAYGVIKREKLRKKSNQKPSNKSGFLSLHRSPEKLQKHEHSIVKQETPAFKHKLVFNSPPTKLPKPHEGNTVTQTTFDDTTTLEPQSYIAKQPMVKDSPMFNTPINFQAQSNPKEKRRNQKATKTHHHKGLMNNAVDSMVDDLIEDTVKSLNVVDKQTDVGWGAVEGRAECCKNMYHRILQIEDEETSIRLRWRTLDFEDSVCDDIAKVKAERNTENEHHRDVEPITISNTSDSIEPNSPKRNIVRFRKPKNVRQYEGENSFPKPTAISGKTKIPLTLHKDTLNSIVANKIEHDRYLYMTHHQPVGNFNPWKVINGLSNEIMNELFTSVFKEVNGIFEGCVDDLFEGEFAEPNRSALTSIAESSSDLSSILNNPS